MRQLAKKMKNALRRPADTLFARTALALSVALLAFVLLTGVLTFRYILAPVGHRAADDLAALMVLSARIWAASTPRARPDFVAELQRDHQLLVRERLPETALLPLDYSPPYLSYLEASLSRRLGRPTPLRRSAERADWYWVAIPVGETSLFVGFSHDRIGARPPRLLLGIFLGAGLFILSTTLFVVRLINRPLARLDAGVRQLGRLGFSDPLPETGPRELAHLARKFNQLGREICTLLENRTTLLGGISHDLRTPLARLRIAVELLEGTEDERLLCQMRADLEEMDQLIGRTLELAGLMQPGAGDEAVRPLPPLLRALQADYARQGRTLALDVSDECQAELPALSLRRILVNLLDNAFTYGSGSPVKLNVRCSAEEIRICVLDQGPGLPGEALERVFQPFQREEPSRSRATGGSGLGLAIVRQLAEARGWRVTLANRPEGGLAACIEIPFAG